MEPSVGKIEVTGDNKDDKINFYTALYHTMIAPTIYSDVDGAYYGPDKKIHQTDGWVNYGTFSLWDTYRNYHQFDDFGLSGTSDGYDTYYDGYV